MTSPTIVQLPSGLQVRVPEGSTPSQEVWLGDMSFPLLPEEKATTRQRKARPIRPGDNDLRAGEVGGPGTRPYQAELAHRPELKSRHVQEYL